MGKVMLNSDEKQLLIDSMDPKNLECSDCGVVGLRVGHDEVTNDMKITCADCGKTVVDYIGIGIQHYLSSPR